MLSYQVMSDSLLPHGLWPIRLLCPWNFPGKNTGVGCHFLFQEIFSTQGWNPVSCVSCIGMWVLYQWATWEAQSFRYYHLKCFGGISKNKQNYLKMLSTYSFLFQIHSCKRPDILHVVQTNQNIIINWIQKQIGESVFQWAWHLRDF